MPDSAVSYFCVFYVDMNDDGLCDLHCGLAFEVLGEMIIL